MRRRLMQRSAFALLVTAIALGCRADTTGLATLTVSEAARLLAGDEPVAFCDANTDATREKFGTIPGAVLLTSYQGYDPASELPAGAKLVFYCHSETCSAAVQAARRALTAGRDDVAVMPAGIRGWVSAGRPVERLAAG